MKAFDVGVGAAITLAAVAFVKYGRTRRARGHVRVTYWAGRGRAEPIRVILAAAGVNFESRFFSAETGKQELDEIRAAGDLEYDQVPLYARLTRTRATSATKFPLQMYANLVYSALSNTRAQRGD